MPVSNTRGVFPGSFSVGVNASPAPSQSSADIQAEIAKILGGNDLLAALKSGSLSPDEKLAVASRQLSDLQKASVKTLVTKEQAQPLDPLVRNFLSALVGLEALTPTNHVDDVARVSAIAVSSVEVQAVEQFKAIMKAGRLPAYYDAAVGVSDNPELQGIALELFANLPSIGPASGPEVFVAAGLWSTPPRNFDKMEKSARYLPGRQVLVRTNVDVNLEREESFLTSKEGGGTRAITYRARIVGEDGPDFLVKVDGSPAPIKIPKQELFDLNQPQDFSTAIRVSTPYGEGYKVGDWWQSIVDYDEPMMKAKVAEAAVKMSDLVGKIDFAKVQGEGIGGIIGTLFGLGSGRKTVDIQKECAKVIHDVIDMKYPSGSEEKLHANGRERASMCGRAAVRGIGMCREQVSVMYAMIQPFSRALGVDVQLIDGIAFHGFPVGEGIDFRRSNHGWLQVSYRPTMELFVIDRTWNKCNQPVDEAYLGRRGDRYPARIEDIAGLQAVSPTDVRCDGSVSVALVATQFPEAGKKVGREDHMAFTQAED